MTGLADGVKVMDQEMAEGEPQLLNQLLNHNKFTKQSLFQLHLQQLTLSPKQAIPCSDNIK